MKGSVWKGVLQLIISLCLWKGTAVSARADWSEIRVANINTSEIRILSLIDATNRVELYYGVSLVDAFGQFLNVRGADYITTLTHSNDSVAFIPELQDIGIMNSQFSMVSLMLYGVDVDDVHYDWYAGDWMLSISPAADDLGTTGQYVIGGYHDVSGHLVGDFEIGLSSNLERPWIVILIAKCDTLLRSR